MGFKRNLILLVDILIKLGRELVNSHVCFFVGLKVIKNVAYK